MWNNLVFQWRSLPRHRKMIWAAALVVCLFHLLGIMGFMLADPTYTEEESREWSDIVTYRDAAHALSQRQDLYEINGWEDEMTFHYHPTFALGVSVMDSLSMRVFSVLWLLLNVSAYLGAIYVWYRILMLLDLPPVMDAYKTWLPLTIVFTEWFVNLAYGNIASLLMLFSGLVVWAFVKDRPHLASLAALPLALFKPQWLFPLLLPIVFRKWRFFLLMVSGLLVLYVMASGLYLLAVGRDYGQDSLEDYYTFIQQGGRDYPWEMGTKAFDEMNHSWEQIFLSYFGEQTWTGAATLIAKGLLLAILGGLILLAWQRDVTLSGSPELVLWFTGLGYLVALSLLPQLWEVLNSVVFFLFIRSVKNPFIRRVSLLYLVYAFYEVAFIVGYATGIDLLILPQSIPLTMLTLLLVYVILAYSSIQTLSKKV
jgi:Glycosyltransferase family 87